MYIFRVGIGLAYYGISFGVQALSGNIFVNMVLFNVTGVPTKAIGMWLQNRYIFLGYSELYETII